MAMSDAIRFLNDLRRRKLDLTGDGRNWRVEQLVEHATTIGYSFNSAELRQAYSRLWQVESVAFTLRRKSTDPTENQPS